jgi:cell division protein FtsB
MRKRTILWRRNLCYTVLIIVAIIVVIILFRWIGNLYNAYSQASARLEQAQSREQALEDRKTRLVERNELLHTTTGQRDFLVKRQAMISEGERVLVLVEDNRQGNQNTTSPQEPAALWWQWWRD